jgi:LCP family protein required for cell wall assembly
VGAATLGGCSQYLVRRWADEPAAPDLRALVSDHRAAPEQPPGGSPAAGSQEAGRPGPRRARSFAGALGLTVAGSVLPGTAFLATGRRKLGAVTLLVFLLLVAGAVYLATAGRRTAIRWAVEADSLLWVIGVVVVVATAWILIVVTGYRMVTPRPTRWWQHGIGALVVLLLAAAVAVPAVEVGRLAAIQRNLITDVFGHHQSATVVDKPDPFAGKDRINVLLLGGDSGPDRTGLRTDTVVVASIDTHTGGTTLFSLPRNLENLPFPAGSALAAAYPNGFTAAKEDEGLLNAVYDNAPAAHPGLVGASDNPGADWLKLGVGTALGLHIDYYALVNMAGFSTLVDALGGITVNTNYWVPINGIPNSRVLPDDYFTPGPNQHLDGWHALQWARGRFGLSDYLRMDRQRCALDAILKAADPATVLNSYQKIAKTAENSIKTDIPESALQEFVDLGFKAKNADVRSVVFDTNAITPAYPDYGKIRNLVQQALSGEVAPQSDPPAAPSSDPAAATPSGTPSLSGPAPVSETSNACAYNPTEAQAALAQGKPPTRQG